MAKKLITLKMQTLLGAYSISCRMGHKDAEKTFADELLEKYDFDVTDPTALDEDKVEIEKR